MNTLIAQPTNFRTDVTMTAVVGLSPKDGVRTTQVG
jgi:hypothetical protein